MKILKIILVVVWYIAAALVGCLTGLGIAEDYAYRGALDDEYLDLCELAIEEDNNCRIKTIDKHNIKKGEVTYLCVYNNDESSSFFVVLELKKVAPFRYEWVVRE